jgi:hypothetical protein
MAKLVALTVRKLKPGAYDGWREAWEGGADDTAPSGAKAYIARKVDDPDTIVAFGMIDASMDDLQEMRPSSETEQARLAAMAPFIDSIESDGLYEVIEEKTF